MGGGKIIVFIGIGGIIAALAGIGYLKAPEIKGFIASKGWLGLKPESEATAAAASAPAAPKFCPPELCIEMQDTTAALHGDQNQILRIAMTVQMSDKDGVSWLNRVLPRVQDAFQIYLRGLTITDVNGPENRERLRAEMLKRMNAVIGPAKAEAIYFREVLIQ